MSRVIEIQTTVRGGLPVIAKGIYVRAEPDVGMFYPGVEDVTFFWLSGKQISLSVEESIPKNDFERVEVELVEAFARDDREWEV